MADLAQKYSDSADFSTFSFKIFGLCRFFNIFLHISYILTWRIWHKTYSDSADFSTYSFIIFGLCRFINIFLQISYLLTWRIWHKKIFGFCRFFNLFLNNIRTLPIYQHFSSDFLSFNMADLALNIRILPIFQLIPS